MIHKDGWIDSMKRIAFGFDIEPAALGGWIDSMKRIAFG
jgi:hypothetical protein